MAKVYVGAWFSWSHPFADSERGRPHVCIKAPSGSSVASMASAGFPSSVLLRATLRFCCSSTCHPRCEPLALTAALAPLVRSTEAWLLPDQVVFQSTSQNGIYRTSSHGSGLWTACGSPAAGGLTNFSTCAAFIQFADMRDAEDACDKLNGAQRALHSPQIVPGCTSALCSPVHDQYKREYRFDVF